MRDPGIPKLLTWRWAPFAALVLGSLSFVAFVTLAIPERIGEAVDGAHSSASFRLGNHLTRSQGASSEPVDFSGDTSREQPAPSSATRIAAHTPNPGAFPKRGFSPPLDRPDPPPAPAPLALVPPPPPQAPAVEAVQVAPPPGAPVEQPIAAQPDLPQQGNSLVSQPAPTQPE